MKQIKEIREKIKELRKTEEGKAKFRLVFLAVFLLVVILFSRGMNTSRNIKQENTINNTLNSYEYTYKDNNITIFGQKYNDKEIFTILNTKYYYDGTRTYIVNDRTLNTIDLDLGILKITPELIENLTEKIEPIQNEETKRYLVPLTNFINLYELDTDIDLSYLESYNIVVEKYYSNNDLYMIKLDLTNYYKLKNIQDNGIITIDLYNKNKLNDFTEQYDKMIGVIK